jgi:hypothetical protein
LVEGREEGRAEVGEGKREKEGEGTIKIDRRGGMDLKVLEEIGEARGFY